MIEDFLRKPWVVAQLRASVLGPDLDGLADELERLGYKPSTIQGHLRVAGHLAYWLEREHIELEWLSEATIGRFVEQHLPCCRCRVPRATRSDIRGVGPHLLKVLRARGRISRPSPATLAPIDAIIRAFTEHLQRNRGAVTSTCERYVREIHPFLVETFGVGSFESSRLTAAALRTYVAERASRRSLRAGRRAASALRNFLRFLHLQGLVDGQLVGAVPVVRDTRYSTLPVPLSSAQLRQLLGSIDRGKPAGLRDYAMVLCLAQLGLRAKEVAELTLDDIDWRAGTVTIARSKARRASVLPLPKSIGRAIVTYLQQSRPPTPVRRVFVRHLFPLGAPLRSVNVTNAVQHAIHRSGLAVLSRGAHTLRHTAATEMVRAGVSLKAVADVLGHRSIDTTAIYTKLDLARLREVALPWPEGEP